MKRLVDALCEHAFFAAIASAVLVVIYTAGHLAVLWLTRP